MLVIEAGCILIGLLMLCRKYRVVIGGTICMATIARVQVDSSGGRFPASPLCTVRFMYNEELFHKPSDIISYFKSKKKLLGKNVLVYYNVKFPKSVARKGLTAVDVYSFLLILIGVVTLFFRFNIGT